MNPANCCGITQETLSPSTVHLPLLGSMVCSAIFRIRQKQPSPVAHIEPKYLIAKEKGPVIRPFFIAQLTQWL